MKDYKPKFLFEGRNALFIIALSTLITACASYRIEDSPTGESVEVNKVYVSEDPDDQLICRKEKVMGSNLRQRVCYRKRDLEAKSKLDQEDYREMNTRAVRPTTE